MSYVGLSVRPSVTLCILAKRYIQQQKWLNKWIGSALLGTQTDGQTYDSMMPTADHIACMIAPSGEFLLHFRLANYKFGWKSGQPQFFSARFRLAYLRMGL